MDERCSLESIVNRITSSNSLNPGLNEIERSDSRSKVREVIFIDDSPLNSTSTTINGETPSPSIHEEDDNSSVQEVFLDNTTVTLSSRPLVVHIQDDLDEEIEIKSLPSSSETSLNLNNSSSIVIPSQESDNQITCSPEVKRSLKNFTIPCLDSITSLKSQFESRYELHLRLRKVAGCNNRVPRSRMYKFKKDLHQQLDEWEEYLNEQSHNEAYIAVENTIDNEGPPGDFEYITHNLLHEDVRHVHNNDFLVGCSCERICMKESCDCPRNGARGGQFAYDRNGQVRVKPGTPIYECNSRCPCGLSCRNRVLQRGRTVKVAIFRTPNGCGWGVKTMELIEKHQLVTEYVGEAITQEEAEERGKVYDSCGQTYLFDLDFNEGECLYTLDAKKYGNISHFINHSCDPNLDVYAVWVDSLDPNFPRIAFFANRRIKVGEELTFDYQMTMSEVGSSSPRKKERIKCHCGAQNCREYLC